MLRQASIKKRLTLLLTAISAIAVLLTTIAISVVGIYNIRQNLLSELVTTVATVGQGNQASVYYWQSPVETSNVEKNLQAAFGVKPSVLRACMYNLAGENKSEVFQRSDD